MNNEWFIQKKHGGFVKPLKPLTQMSTEYNNCTPCLSHLCIFNSIMHHLQFSDVWGGYNRYPKFPQ